MIIVGNQICKAFLGCQFLDIYKTESLTSRFVIICHDFYLHICMPDVPWESRLALLVEGASLAPFSSFGGGGTGGGPDGGAGVAVELPDETPMKIIIMSWVLWDLSLNSGALTESREPYNLMRKRPSFVLAQLVQQQW